MLAIFNAYLITQKPAIPLMDKMNGTKFDFDSDVFQKNDIIISLNSLKVYSSEELEFLCDQREIDDNVLIDIARNGEVVTKNIRLVPYYSTFYLIVMLITGFTFYFTSIFVLLKNQTLKFAFVFHWFGIAAATMILLDYGKIFNNIQFLNFLLRLTFDTATAFTPLLFLHFSLLFPKVKFESFAKYYKIIYLVGALLISITAFYQYQVQTTLLLSDFREYNILHTFHLKMLLAPILLLVIINYAHSYFKTIQEDEKRKLKWIFLGILVGPAVYVFLYSILKILEISSPIVNESFMLSVLIIAPISFFIAIYRYRILDINLIVNKGMVFSIILVVYICIFLILTFLFVPSLEVTINNVSGNSIKPADTSKIAYIIISIFAIFAFEPFKNYVQNYIDMQFFRARYNFKTILNTFLSKIKELPTEQEVVNYFFNSIHRAIPLESMAILQTDRNIKVLKSDNLELNEENLDSIYFFLKSSSFLPLYSSVASTEEELESEEISEDINSLGIQIIVNSIGSPEQPKLTCLIGKKKSDTRFSVEDVELIITLLESTNVALQKIYLQSELILNQEEANRLKELNDLKSYFVSSVSHELKTPLTAIKLYAEVLNSNPKLTDEKKQTYLSIIEGECDRLDRLINNVLGFSKIEKGTKSYRFEFIDLREVIDYIIHTFQYQLKIQNFSLELEVEDGYDYKVYGDRDALKEVLINLISNSIKYSILEKKIIIHLAHDSNLISLSITDFGIGIKEEDLINIFSPFYRSKDKNVSNLGGAGLGLAIVKSILDEHEAEILVESKIGKGTTFKINFPIKNENKNSDC